MNLPVAVFCLLMFGILAKLSSRLKKVSPAGGTLYVSNYLKQVRIPLSAVAAVDAQPDIKFEVQH